MRIQRIQFSVVGDADPGQSDGGRRSAAAAADWKIALDPSYSVVLAEGQPDAEWLASLLLGLLYPRRGLEAIWHGAGDIEGEADVALSLDSGEFLVHADFAQRKLELSRMDPSTGRYEVHASGADEVGDRLRREGVPHPDVFQALCTRGAAIPLPPPDAVAAKAEEAEPEQPPAQSDEEAREALAAAQARLVVLRADRDELVALEQEYKTVYGDLDDRAPLAEVFEDADAQISEYRAHFDALETARTQIRETRRHQLDERIRLASNPNRYTAPMGIGIGLAVAGGAMALISAYVGIPMLAGLASGAAGVVIAGLAALFGSLSRRGQKSVEVAIAALRVQERKAEREFDEKVGPVRRLLDELGIETVEELETSLAEYREYTQQLEALHHRLKIARGAFPPDALAELTRLEEVMGAPDAAALLSTSNEKPSVPPVAPEETRELDTGSPQGLVAAAAQLCEKDQATVVAKLAASLPAYLGALTDDVVERADWAGNHWTVTGPQIETLAFSDLGPAEQDITLLAFRLALLEILAPDAPLPFVVGLSTGIAEDDELGFARALKHAGESIQVLQLSAGDERWAEFASCAHRLVS